MPLLTRTGNTNLFCLFELPGWAAWFPSRSRSCGTSFEQLVKSEATITRVTRNKKRNVSNTRCKKCVDLEGDQKCELCDETGVFYLDQTWSVDKFTPRRRRSNNGGSRHCY